ncbi:hypothetical protein SAMN02983004_00903 [Borreliella japonica]|uniref:Lipoprotein n=1 Tax=Borreliella japonica TaxID=34095 RepID=A0A1G4Q3C8_BORJA|nr:Lp6.6 family lipoprotein [Borreliella japonica]WKC88620.1 Lp6.6 family lipoprotein [Borreliella japonica]WKC88626.1 Lp6.6 family lipoprotein [Borreliella japonica]SCW38935.1 hypothetical protein SAMN02983004_00903 [Borreliella japonica]
MTKLMYAIFLSTILFIACETTRISDEMENTSDDDSKVTTPMQDKSMKSTKKSMKSIKK